MEGGRGKLRQADREQSLQALMTVNLLKRLESSVESFRLTLAELSANITPDAWTIASFERSGEVADVSDFRRTMISTPDDEDDC